MNDQLKTIWKNLQDPAVRQDHLRKLVAVVENPIQDAIINNSKIRLKCYSVALIAGDLAVAEYPAEYHAGLCVGQDRNIITARALKNYKGDGSKVGFMAEEFEIVASVKITEDNIEQLPKCVASSLIAEEDKVYNKLIQQISDCGVTGEKPTFFIRLLPQVLPVEDNIDGSCSIMVFELVGLVAPVKQAA